mmetsp:Transcript_54339/g.157083  ORF Transcript_54339/g.157083 Transcript_54339/m.157083 type:complete len:238 (-) Transcript_54339:2256-2969(-)
MTSATKSCPEAYLGRRQYASDSSPTLPSSAVDCDASDTPPSALTMVFRAISDKAVHRRPSLLPKLSRWTVASNIVSTRPERLEPSATFCDKPVLRRIGKNRWWAATANSVSTTVSASGGNIDSTSLPQQMVSESMRHGSVTTPAPAPRKLPMKMARAPPAFARCKSNCDKGDPRRKYTCGKRLTSSQSEGNVGAKTKIGNMPVFWRPKDCRMGRTKCSTPKRKSPFNPERPQYVKMM